MTAATVGVRAEDGSIRITLSGEIDLELIVPLDSPVRRLIEMSGFESLAALRP